MSELGNRIRQARLDKGWSQDTLAAQLQRTRSAVSQYESGARMPDAATLRALATILGVTTDQLLGLPEGQPEMPDDVRAIMRGARALPEWERRELLAYIQFKREQRRQEESRTGGNDEGALPSDDGSVPT